jgi:hypothetical protein
MIEIAVAAMNLIVAREDREAAALPSGTVTAIPALD